MGKYCTDKESREGTKDPFPPIHLPPPAFSITPFNSINEVEAQTEVGDVPKLTVGRSWKVKVTESLMLGHVFTVLFVDKIRVTLPEFISF